MLNASKFFINLVLSHQSKQVGRAARREIRAVAVGVARGGLGARACRPRQPDRLTAPLALFRLVGTPGEALRGQAMALAGVLMVLTAASVLAIEGWGRRGAVRGDL